MRQPVDYEAAQLAKAFYKNYFFGNLFLAHLVAIALIHIHENSFIIIVCACVLERAMCACVDLLCQQTTLI